MKKILSFTLFFTIAFSAFAQNESDALRYSNTSYFGTARFMGLSGAYGAIGADFSSLSQNPAGIGLYRRSEFTISPYFNFNNTSSEFFGTKTNDRSPNFKLGNIGYVHTILFTNKDSKLKTLQFGIGINKIADFNSNIYISGLNTQNSFLTPYVNRANDPKDPAYNANSKDWNPYGMGMAYAVNLIVYDTASKTFKIDVPKNVMQTKSVKTTGGISETVLSAGANIQDKVYVGLTIGLPEISYAYISNYTEENTDNPASILKHFTRHEEGMVKGSGVNAKIGAIYKPIDNLRLGFAVHTPTYYYYIKDDFYSSMTSNFKETKYNARNESPKDAAAIEYTLTTPTRLMASAAYFFEQKGLISVDYEYINYAAARFNANENKSYYMSVNNEVKNLYQNAHNLRIGAEWKYNILAFRGGYRFSSAPYKDGNDLGLTQGFSAGAGVHGKNYFFDLSYNRLMSKDDYYLYSGTVAKNTYNSNIVSATVGIKF